MSAGKNSLIYISFNILQKSFGFITLPLMTHLIDPSGLGKIALFSICIPILATVGTFSSTGAATAFTYKAKSLIEVKQVWGNTLIFIMVLSSVFYGGLILLYPVTHLLIPDLSFKEFVYICVVTFFNGIYNQYQSYLQAHKRAKQFSVNGLVFTITNFLLLLFFVLIQKCGYMGFIYSVLCTNVIFALYSLVYALKKYSFKLDMKIIKQLTDYSKPMVVTGLFAVGLSYMDRFFVNQYLGLASLGIYGVACSLVSFIPLVNDGINKSYNVFSFEMLKSRDYEAIQGFCIKVFTVYVSLLLLFCWFSSVPVLVLLGDQYESARWLLPIFGLAYFFHLNYGFLCYVILFHKPSYITKIVVLGGGVNLLSNLLLTPYFGMVGATISTTLSYLISYLIAIYYSIQLEGDVLIWRNYLKINIVVVTIVIPSIFILYIQNHYVLFGLSICGVLVSFIIFFIMMRFIFRDNLLHYKFIFFPMFKKAI